MAPPLARSCPVRSGQASLEQRLAMIDTVWKLGQPFTVEEDHMRDDRGAITKYLTALTIWLVPVALMLIPILYPAEGIYRDMFILPVILIMLYVAFILTPMFSPLKNVDFFDELPRNIERFVDGLRARRDARDILRLYDKSKMPNVYEMEELSPYLKNVRRTCDVLRASRDWHASNAEVQGTLLEKMEALMHYKEAPEEEPEEKHGHKAKGKHHRSH